MEKKLIEVKQQKEEYEKLLLSLEWILGYGSTITFLAIIFLASYIKMDKILVVTLITGASIFFAIGMSYCIKIEQIVGYYKCEKCGHKYVPTYKSVLFAPHIGRTRYMRCPKKSFHKKVTKE